MFILSTKCLTTWPIPRRGRCAGKHLPSLAYGMKGILYFVYWPYPPLGKSAIVDMKGKPTRLYPIIKRLNGDIRAIGPTLLSLRSTGTYHSGPDSARGDAVAVGCAAATAGR